MLAIVNAPNEVLSQKAKPVEKVNSDIKKLIEEMKITLDATDDPKGVGLAAPQVGKSLQIFVIKQTSRSPFLTFVNPRITQSQTELSTEPFGKLRAGQSRNESQSMNPQKSSKDVKLEGCLSLPTIWGSVQRKPSLFLEYLDENGKKHKRKFSGFLATIIQHEYDHLQGVLFPKRVLEQKGKLYKSKKDKKGEDLFEEIAI